MDGPSGLRIASWCSCGLLRVGRLDRNDPIPYRNPGFRSPAIEQPFVANVRHAELCRFGPGDGVLRIAINFQQQGQRALVDDGIITIGKAMDGYGNLVEKMLVAARQNRRVASWSVAPRLPAFEELRVERLALPEAAALEYVRTDLDSADHRRARKIIPPASTIMA